MRCVVTVGHSVAVYRVHGRILSSHVHLCVATVHTRRYITLCPVSGTFNYLRLLYPSLLYQVLLPLGVYIVAIAHL